MVKLVVGDLIKMAKDGEFDVIVHGANCRHTMGAGIAKFIRREFPAAYEADLKTEKGRGKLGTFSEAECGKVVVVNAYSQDDYTGKGCKLDYNALRLCLRSVCGEYGKMRIGLPLIGCGLAGGNTEKVLRIICQEMGSTDTKVVLYG